MLSYNQKEKETNGTHDSGQQIRTMYLDNIAARHNWKYADVGRRLVPVMIAAWKQAAKIEIHTAKPKANIQSDISLFPFQQVHKAVKSLVRLFECQCRKGINMDRVEQNLYECTDYETGEFDWEEYQYLCDLADYWDCEE